MTINEYDEIAKEYEEATIRPVRKWCHDYTIKNYITDLSGKRVLDIGCGEGVSTRMMQELGAKEIVGIDNSSKLIKRANEKGGDGIDLMFFQKTGLR
jgi:2-polyprenyl-3-methyl-5-hydroxy-6-metoxy-1,4-benzoquinol methylase